MREAEVPGSRSNGNETLAALLARVEDVHVAEERVLRAIAAETRARALVLILSDEEDEPLVASSGGVADADLEHLAATGHALLLSPSLAAPGFVRIASHRPLGVLGGLPGAGMDERGLEEALARLAPVVAIAFERSAAVEASRRAQLRVEELLAIMSHDLRSPLGVVLMTANLVRRDLRRVPQPVPNAEVHLDALERAAKRIDRLVDDLVELSRLESGIRKLAPSVGPLAPIVSAALLEAESVTAAERRKVHLEVSVSPALPAVRGDPRCTQRLVRALLSHAMQFAREGTAMRVEANARGDSVALRVLTSGNAFTQDELDRVTCRNGAAALGAGIELAVAAGLARAQSGRVTASATGEACVLELELPAAEAGARRAAA